MKVDWKPTNEYYHAILAAPNPAARQQRYLELLIQPWKPMMDMMSRTFGAEQPDALAGARAWNWLLPDQVAEISDVLNRLEAANAWQTGAEALAQAAARFEPYAGRLPFDTISGWLALADPARSGALGRGYTGAIDWTQPRFVGQFWDPNEYNLPRLPGLVAHEMHHLIRLNGFPFDLQRTSVADYIVLEGMAEAFAASLFGSDKVGYFVTDFDSQEFETARRLIGQGLRATGFNVIRSYLFGDGLAERSGYQALGGMPTFGGYAVGYHVVQAFLERSGQSIEAATFLPASEVVARSGLFD